ncbi:MAG: DUF3135 domain-containing protein [Gammaproteobacteria bacterium]|nr:DUF3135 domain-containing protein [Gammaproteobacteria bacterium]MDP2140528.1 DUF3135 domain-containing protein [Gammaproteobacteria bacterium]MDP2347297.1 DUF3135 domain-containing protein [Gammaproteobacteria bacterium]
MPRELPDFDTLVHLHRENPEELERLRVELTSAIMENAPPEARRRLEGLQFRINMELRKARTPEARCVKLSSMMHESFAELNHALHNPPRAVKPDTGISATVIPFSASRDKTRDH